MHDHPHQHLIHQRTWRISTLPASLEGVSNMSFMAHHCTHLSRTFRMSLENFNRQVDRTQQLLQFLSKQSSAPTQLLATIQVELTNINYTYISYKPITIPVINHLNMDPSFDGNSKHNNHIRRSLLPFLGDTLSWLTGTATTKDVNNIKKRVNQLIEAQSTQQETLVHIISILNVTRYVTQVNRHSINVLMDKVDKTVQDVNNLYNLTTSLATALVITS